VDTLKRGDLDVDGKDDPRTHDCAMTLLGRSRTHFCCLANNHRKVRGVVAANETNLLEDDAGAEALALERTTGEEGGGNDGRWKRCRSGLGFEVKTIKLMLAKEGMR
jgi:hypothetical protein